MNQRIAKISRYSDLKVFKKGVQLLSRLTASEYRDMMKIMIFMVDGLYKSNLQNFQKHRAINGYTTETYESLHKTYVKISYCFNNKKEVEKQIMENTSLITEIRLSNKLIPLYLALVQWYDFKSEITLFIYNCPLLELVELYNFIEIEVIENIVHVISHFDKTNKHFVIKFGPHTTIKSLPFY
ncbi:hypothetical protein Glove_691g7 [Diversispora epigaea]|uniref:Uncharacterized protein n=1 Tax=Diversispora epigaea TaxID=1348612 RepID=A0A397G2B8_9GLOM|nr:hypothetical protein Glove_691g7 [Diversispora epigaea]